MWMGRTKLASTFFALLVTMLGVAVPAHVHASTISGWHDASPHGCKHQTGQGSCSICRLAHERTIATATPLYVGRPGRVQETAAPTRDDVALAPPAHAASSRAPPASAIC
jgi:hypothetical protein